MINPLPAQARKAAIAADLGWPPGAVQARLGCELLRSQFGTIAGDWLEDPSSPARRPPSHRARFSW